MDSRPKNEEALMRMRMHKQYASSPFVSAVTPKQRNTTQMSNTRFATPISTGVYNGHLDGEISRQTFQKQHSGNTPQSNINKRKPIKGKETMVQTKRWVSPRATNTPVPRAKKQQVSNTQSSYSSRAQVMPYHTDPTYTYDQQTNEYHGPYHGLQASNHVNSRAHTPVGNVYGGSYHQELSYDSNLSHHKISSHRDQESYSMVHTPPASTRNSATFTPTIRQKIHQQRSLFEKLQNVVVELSSSAITDYQAMGRLEQQLNQYSTLVRDQDKMLEDIERMNAKLSAERDMLIALRDSTDIADGVSRIGVTPIDKRRKMLINDPNVDVSVAAQEVASINMTATSDLAGRGNQNTIIASLIQSIRDEKRQRLAVEEQSSRLISEQQLTITRLEHQIRELKQRGYTSLRGEGNLNAIANYTHPRSDDVEYRHSRLPDKTTSPAPNNPSMRNANASQANPANDINTEIHRGKDGRFIEPSEYQYKSIHENSAMNQQTSAPMNASASSHRSVLDEFDDALAATGIVDHISDSHSPNPNIDAGEHTLPQDRNGSNPSHNGSSTTFPSHLNNRRSRNSSAETKSDVSSKPRSMISAYVGTNNTDVLSGEELTLSRPNHLRNGTVISAGISEGSSVCDNRWGGSAHYTIDCSDRASGRLSLSKRSSIASETSNPFDDALEEIRRRHNL